MAIPLDFLKAFSYNNYIIAWRLPGKFLMDN